MRQDDNRGTHLSRRSLLAGLGTVGVASAGASLGTSALFSDEESFDDNQLTAGALNLRVSVDNIVHSTDVVRDNTTITPKDTADGAAVTVSVSDVKPGDWLILEWNPEVMGSPGHVQVTSVDDDFANREGANPESETDTASPGDLGDALLSTIWATYDNLGSGPQYLAGLDPTTDNANSGLPGYEEPTDPDGTTASGAHYTTMNECHAVYRSGVTLRDDGDPMEIGSRSEGAWFYQLLELPAAVGNEIQGDELTFTLRFDAEQVRNNPTPFHGT